MSRVPVTELAHDDAARCASARNLFAQQLRRLPRLRRARRAGLSESRRTRTGCGAARSDTVLASIRDGRSRRDAGWLPVLGEEGRRRRARLRDEPLGPQAAGRQRGCRQAEVRADLRGVPWRRWRAAIPQLGAPNLTDNVMAARRGARDRFARRIANGRAGANAGARRAPRRYANQAARGLRAESGTKQATKRSRGRAHEPPLRQLRHRGRAPSAAMTVEPTSTRGAAGIARSSPRQQASWSGASFLTAAAPPDDVLRAPRPARAGARRPTPPWWTSRRAVYALGFFFCLDRRGLLGGACHLPGAHRTGAGRPQHEIARANARCRYYVAEQKIYPREVTGRLRRACGRSRSGGCSGCSTSCRGCAGAVDRPCCSICPRASSTCSGSCCGRRTSSYLTALLVIAALALFFFTAVGGRLWCGYACPQTVWTEAFLWMERIDRGHAQQRIKLDQGAVERQQSLSRKSAETASLWLTFSLWHRRDASSATSRRSDGGCRARRGRPSRSVPGKPSGSLFYGFATYGNARATCANRSASTCLPTRASRAPCSIGTR